MISEITQTVTRTTSPKTILRGGYGIYYDSINVQNLTLSQSGFSKTTSTNLTNDFGINWLAGNPGAGVSPLADPFPVRSDGTRFDAPLGNSLGSMYVAGQGFSFRSFNRRHPRQQQWRVGVQRQLSPNMSLEAFLLGFVGRPPRSQPEPARVAGAVLEHQHGSQRRDCH